ncbi:MAG: LacI family DNA-binding transcriptional regulator [Friedmanniella sp.]
MPATMQDVADRAGVSIATVSFVVNNTKRVTPDTRARIEQAMQELGFRRNLVARALASRRTRIIALVLAALDHGIRGASSDFVVGAARAASDADYHLVVYPDDQKGGQLPALVGQGLVDGVVLMEVQMEDSRVELLTRLGVPFALIGRTGDTTGLYSVDIDFDAAMRLAIDHLVALGHRRIVYMPSIESGAALLGRHVRTEAAYRRMAERHGIPPVVMPCPSSVPDGRAAALRLASMAPEATAVVVGHEAVAAGLVAGLQARGITIPDDMSVLSLLTSLEYRSACNPPLTVVSTPANKLGQLGVQALLRQLDGEPPTEPVLRVGVLVPGESTGQAPTPSPPR